jgi:hypothetical protein
VMKKYILAILIMAITTSAHAGFFDFIFGNQHNGNKNRGRQEQSNNPVSVPEPGTWILLGSGLCLLAIKLKRRK